jgi:hypothetical protein
MSASPPTPDINPNDGSGPLVAEGVEELRRSKDFETMIQNTSSD